MNYEQRIYYVNNLFIYEINYKLHIKYIYDYLLLDNR